MIHVLFKCLDKLATRSSICAECIDPNTTEGLAPTNGAELGRLHFTKFTRKSALGSLGIGTIARVFHRAAIGNRDTFPSIETSMDTARTEIKLILALHSDVSARAYAVLEILVVCRRSITVKAKLFQQADILCSLSANTVVLASQVAFD